MTSEPSRLRLIFRDPVARFLAIGALIFAAHELFDRDRTDEAIVVSSRFVEGLEAEHRERFGRRPSPSESEALVRRFVREEALVREARDIGLDRTDPIVRRRLAQKMELALRGRLSIPRPSDAEVRRYLEANPESVATDERFSFRHAFVSLDRHGDSTRAAAEAIAAELRGEPDPASTVATRGEAFPLGPSAEHMTAGGIEERFGSGVASAVASCALGSVCGPIESRYGFHVLVVTAHEPAGTLEFAVARPIAERAMLRAREDAALEREIDSLVAGRGVVRPHDRSER